MTPALAAQTLRELASGLRAGRVPLHLAVASATGDVVAEAWRACEDDHALGTVLIEMEHEREGRVWKAWERAFAAHRCRGECVACARVIHRCVPTLTLRDCVAAIERRRATTTGGG